MKSLLLYLFLFLCCFFAVSESITVVHTLPGYPGILPFKLETGYIGVEEDVELFYYFIESERNPMTDPVVLWLTGGPGCSGFSGLVYEIGPLKYYPEAVEGQLPSFVLNPYSWTKVASIIFIDSPAGTGYSYGSSYSEGYNHHPSDTKTVAGVYTFLQKWLLNHPNFIKNRLFIAGDSYAGIWVPMVVFKISQGNEAGDNPYMNLEGYSIGNPKTDEYIDDNSHVPFAHRMGLLSDHYYKMARINCGGNYVNSTNSLCSHSLQSYKKCVENIYVYHVLEPVCHSMLVGQDGGALLLLLLGFSPAFSEDDESMEMIRFPLKQEPLCTREKIYSYCGVWANDPNVQEALHVRKGRIRYWKRCALVDIKFEIDVPSVIGIHQLLTGKGYRVLVYSGDHDFAIPYTGTLEWIRKLNLTMVDDWRPWFVQDEIAGYTEKYLSSKNQQYDLTFATVKGGGHTAPEYKPKECLAMFDRFLSNNPL